MADMFAKVSSRLDRHPKVRKAGNLGRQVFEYVLRANAENGRKGWVSEMYVDPEYLADTLMVTVGDAGDGLRHACHAGLLAVEDGRVLIAGWDEEWASGPVEGADRTRKWRENKKNGAHVTSGDVTNVTQRHGDGGDVVEKSRIEEREKSAAAPLAPAPAKPPRKQSGTSPEAIALAAAAVAELNRLAARNYAPTGEAVLADAQRLAAKGYTPDQAVAVVRAKHRQWAGDAKMAEQLKPSVLLRPSNFAKYLAEDVAATSVGPRPAPEPVAYDGYEAAS